MISPSLPARSTTARPARAVSVRASRTSRSTVPSSSSRSRRMSGRTVMPCTTRVPSTTQKAAKSMKSRNGNGASGPLSGRARAAASVTMPRMPHQATTAASRVLIRSPRQRAVAA